ncbi:hypothetical protein [Streptomyces sp. NPDC003077]|uniref:hypothetical protein n=1 Tax=Streptomyces sp. NPDC003077 TaxID=3154443 RepID=UPI0033AEB630
MLVTGLAVLALPFLAASPLRAFSDYAGGVLTLVSLTTAVVWGLIASDRSLLVPRGRICAQAVHRALATAALGFLLVHITVKIAEGHARLLDAVLPFAPGGAPWLIGLGGLAGHLLVLAAATGALRSAFAGRGRAAGRWRALHGCAYPAWCLAVLHGLRSGRSPSGWVTAAYALCLAAVAGALLVRALLPRYRARRALRRALTARPAPDAAPPVSGPAEPAFAPGLPPPPEDAPTLVERLPYGPPPSTHPAPPPHPQELHPAPVAPYGPPPTALDPPPAFSPADPHTPHTPHGPPLTPDTPYGPPPTSPAPDTPHAPYGSPPTPQIPYGTPLTPHTAPQNSPTTFHTTPHLLDPPPPPSRTKAPS